jgi:hypothetical protein
VQGDENDVTPLWRGASPALLPNLNTLLQHLPKKLILGWVLSTSHRRERVNYFCVLIVDDVSSGLHSPPHSSVSAVSSLQQNRSPMVKNLGSKILYKRYKFVFWNLFKNVDQRSRNSNLNYILNLKFQKWSNLLLYFLGHSPSLLKKMKIRLFGGENIEKSFQTFWSRIESNDESRPDEEHEGEEEDEEFEDDEQRLLPSNWSTLIRWQNDKTIEKEKIPFKNIKTKRIK